MPEPLIAELLDVFATLRIRENEFSLSGATFAVLPNSDKWNLQATYPLPDDPLVRELQAAFYSRCYCRSSRADAANASVDPARDADFLARLSAAISGSSRWDPGWQVYSAHSNGFVEVKKGDRCRRAAPGEFAGAGGTGAMPQIGALVSLQVPREAGYLQAGFYFIFSETLGDQFDDFNTVRIYFHATPDAAIELVRNATQFLNRALLPFRLKCLNSPALYSRADGLVLYVPRRYFAPTAFWLAELANSAAALLLPQVPLFSKELAQGIGLAEDPNNGESFGLHRCRLMAEAIANASRQGEAAPEAWLAAVRRRFAQDGLSLDAPYLNSSSVDHYWLPSRLELRV